MKIKKLVEKKLSYTSNGQPRLDGKFVSTRTLGQWKAQRTRHGISNKGIPKPPPKNEVKAYRRRVSTGRKKGYSFDGKKTVRGKFDIFTFDINDTIFLDMTESDKEQVINAIDNIRLLPKEKRNNWKIWGAIKYYDNDGNIEFLNTYSYFVTENNASTLILERALQILSGYSVVTLAGFEIILTPPVNYSGKLEL